MLAISDVDPVEQFVSLEHWQTSFACDVFVNWMISKK
jgi:hypothetical protein